MVFNIEKGMPLAIWEDKYARKKQDGTFQTWEERVTEVVEGNFSLDPREYRVSGDEYKKTLELAKKGVMIFSGRHLQHGDMDQKNKMGEFFTNCSTAMFSFLKFWLLMKGSGVGRCYDNDLCFTNWDYMPNARFVLSTTHKDYDGKYNIESLEEAQHKYDNDSEHVRWFTVDDTAEGWVKVVEILETAAFHKNNKDHLFIFDFSQIRPFGTPIKGQQNRPASGPIPLIQALQQVSTIKGAGWKPWKQAMFIDHYVSSCVAIGGVRRSARIATKYWKDKDIFEFIDIKRGGWLYTANNSIAVDAEFWEQASSPKPSHGRRVFEYAVSASYYDQTGEPGFLNVDKLTWSNEGLEELNENTYLNPKFSKVLNLHKKTLDMIGYMLNKAKAKKYPFITNPCQPGWAIVATPEGLKKLWDINIGDTIWSSEGWTKVVNKQSSGFKKVYKYETTSGSFYGTENHRLISNGQKIEAKDCKTIDNLYGPRYENNLYLNAQDIMDGLVIGDGSVHKASNDLVFLCIGQNDFDYHTSEIKHLIKEHRPGLKDTAWEIQTTITAEELPLLKYRHIPNRFLLGKPEKVTGFLRGLYSANGSICRERITLKAVSKPLVEAVQLMLSSIGIRSYFTINKSRVNKFSNGDYIMSESYDINITRDRDLFIENIGFIQKYKSDKLKALLDIRKIKRAKTSYKIINTGFISEEEVFNITVDNSTHTYWTGGVNVSNCGEIVLAAYGGYCVIGDICLANCETLDDAVQAARLMPRFLMRANRMDFLYDYEVKRTNRIGVSLTGIHEFAYKFFGLTFENIINKDNLKAVEFRRFINCLEEDVEDSAETYAKEIDVNIPHTMTTVKPSGTVSKVMGCTEGAHLPSMGYYIRWVQFPKHDSEDKTKLSPKVQDLVSRGYPIKDISAQYKDHIVIGFPTKLAIADLMGDNLTTAGMAEPYEQYKWLQLLENFWLDGPGKNNQVSYTLKYDPKRITQEVYSQILLKYQKTVKCCSIMPQEDKSSYIYTPEEELSEFEYNKLIKNINLLDKESYDEESLECASGACPI